MVDLQFKQKDSAGKSFALPVNARHQVTLTPPTVEVLDVEDSHFNFDRKVLLPELSEHDGSEPVLDTRRITGLGVIYAALSHARDHAEQGLVVTGHTDASGTASYNQKLSEERAKNVSLLLRGEREAWRTQAAADDSVDDYQAVLLWQHQRAGWDCDPGPVNNELNAQTKRAIGRFQELYNAEVGAAQAAGLDSPFKTKLTVDKKVGKETWGAIYDVYMSELMQLLDLEKFSELEAIQKALKAAPGMPDFVGCGEHIPFNPARRTPTKGNAEHDGPPKNPPDRRVEILFFDPGEEVPLACHPSPGQCKPDVCPLYTLNPHRQQPVAVPKGLSIAELNLRLTYVDPEGNVRPLPEGLEVEAKFGDPKDDPGPPPEPDITLDDDPPAPAEPPPAADPNEPESMEVDQEPNEQVAANGLLRVVIPRKASSLYLRFLLGDARFVSADPKNPEDQRLVDFRTALADVAEGRVFFELPKEFNTQQGYFELPEPGDVTFFDGMFLNVDIRQVQIGSREAPLELRLKLHWQYFRFDYFDRFSASFASVPQARKDAKGKAARAMVLEGALKLVDADSPMPASVARSAWDVLVSKTAVHCLGWPTRETAADGKRRELPDANCVVAFRGRDLFVRTEGDGSSPDSPRSTVLVEPGDDVLSKSNIERLRLYDLPVEWRSRFYPARIAGEKVEQSRPFEEVAATPSSKDKPYVCSLDVVVMGREKFPVGADTSIALDDTKLANRFAILDNNMAVFKPDPGAGKPFFTRAGDLKPPPKGGVLVDLPPFTRAIVRGRHVYDVFGERTLATENFKGAPVGARLALPLSSGSFRSALLVSASPFRAPQPDSTFTPGRLGDARVALFRLCGQSKGVEQFVFFQYVCVSFIFPTTLNPAHRSRFASLKGAVELDSAPANADARVRTCLSDIAKRWNGEDSVNSTPTTFEVGNPVVARGRYVARLHPGDKTSEPLEEGEFLVTILKKQRAFMSGKFGFWALGDMSVRGDGLTAAHEFGHAFSQPDEYFNTDDQPSYGLTNIGERGRSPGTPYGPDSIAMMTGGETQPRARYFWDLLLFAREEGQFAPENNLAVKRGAIRLAPEVTPTSQTRTRLPVVTKANVSIPPLGLCDLFVYLMGRDEYTARDIDDQAAAKPYDGIVMVRVKMNWTFTTTSEFTEVATLLGRASSAISGAFNTTPLALQGVVGGKSVRLRVKFAPRFVCSTFPTGDGSEAHLDGLGLPKPHQAADYAALVTRTISTNQVHVHVTVGGATAGLSGGTPRQGRVRLDGKTLLIFTDPRFDDDAVSLFAQLLGMAGPPKTALDFAPLLAALAPEVTASVATFNP